MQKSIFEAGEGVIENYNSPIHKNLQLITLKNGVVYMLNNKDNITIEDLLEKDFTYESVLNDESAIEESYFKNAIYGNGSQLIIGSGLGTQARECEKLGLKHKSIEICPVITELFKRFNPTFDIVNEDGFKFLKETDDKWGNIIIDAFNKDAEKVTDIFTSKEFFDVVRNRCNTLSYNLFDQPQEDIDKFIKFVESNLPVEGYRLQSQQDVGTSTINFILKRKAKNGRK